MTDIQTLQLKIETSTLSEAIDEALLINFLEAAQFHARMLDSIAEIIAAKMGTDSADCRIIDAVSRSTSVADGLRVLRKCNQRTEGDAA